MLCISFYLSVIWVCFVVFKAFHDLSKSGHLRNAPASYTSTHIRTFKGVRFGSVGVRDNSLLDQKQVVSTDVLQ